jgi:hypothetical protein
MIPELLYALILDLPFSTALRKEAQMTDIERAPIPLRDIVQMFQNMNPETEADVRQEMKAALAEILIKRT